MNVSGNNHRNAAEQAYLSVIGESLRRRIRLLPAILAALATLAALVLTGLIGPVQAMAAEPSSTAGRSSVGDARPFTSVGVSKTGKTYYVDSSHGNDANDGLDSTRAWKSLDKISATTFAPGDHILLESGSTWQGQIRPKGDGSDTGKIVLDFYTRQTDGSASYEAARRPVINGGGTYGSGSFKRYVSGAVQLTNQEYWTIRNLEVTNSPEQKDLEGYKKHSDAQRVGILLLGFGLDRMLESDTVENCYVHDVQSEYYLQARREGKPQTLKAVGGIIALGHWVDPDGRTLDDGVTNTGFHNLTIQNNIVRRVGLEGIRTKADSSNDSSPGLFEKVTIRNNYLEDIAGDAIVISENKAQGLVEGNTVVRACNADYGTENYAAIWAMASKDVLLQFNEVYGNTHGYNDGEAFDIDMGCDRITYQYNYSHNNGGGFMLLMSNQTNSVIRYNISVNDGAGNSGTNAAGPGHGSYDYKEQSLFHYWISDPGASMPQIYNNTFYVGDGVSTSLFGEGNSGDNSGTIAYFTNNILYKTGSGSLKFLTAYPPDGSQPIEHSLHNNAGDFIKHNLIWPDTVPTAASGATVDELKAAGNVFQAPKLDIDKNTDAAKVIRDQLATILSNPETSLPWSNQVDRMRERASLFKIQTESPAVAAGIRMEGAPSQDMFGGSTKDRGIDIGANQISNNEITTRYEIPETRVSTFAGVYPALPETLNVTVKESSGGSNTEKVTSMPVTWDQLGLKQFSQEGEFTVTGRIQGIPDLAKATVTVTGQMGSGKLRDIRSLADQAATVERGSSEALGAKPGTSSKANGDKYPFGVSYSNKLALKLKNSSSASYNRRFYVKVDPSAYPGQTDQIKKAKLRVYLFRFDINTSAGSSDAERLNNTAFSIDVYRTDPGWDQSTLTWVNGPLNSEVTEANHQPLGTGENIPDYVQLRPGAHQVFTNKEIIDNGYAVDIDVTSILRSMGGSHLTGPISFLVDIPMSDTPNFNRDNGGFDAFSVEGAKQAYADFQSGLLTVPAGVSKPTDEHSLAPQLLISDTYITSVQDVSVTVKPGQVPDLPENVLVGYSDGKFIRKAVNWKVDPALLTHDGVYTVQGKLQNDTTMVKAQVKVESDPIVSFESLPAMDKPVGLARQELGMPTTVKASLASGKQVDLTVTGWDDDPSNYTENSDPGTYHFPGGVSLPMGVSNPSNLKPIQEVRTHPRPESIELKMKRPEVIQGRNAQIYFKVHTAAPFTEPDDWGKEIRWTVAPGASSRQLRQNLPVVDQSGQVRTDQDTPLGTYRITATSIRNAAVAASVEIHVVSPADIASLTQKVNQAKAVKPSAGHQFTVASAAALRTALADAERIINDPDALQAEVNEALANLDAGLLGLREEPLGTDGDTVGGVDGGTDGGADGDEDHTSDATHQLSSPDHSSDATHQPSGPDHGRKSSTSSSSDTGNTVLSATGASVRPAILMILALFVSSLATLVTAISWRRNNTDERES